MLLRRSDIAAFLANWDDKTENLKAIATRLNIGLDSLVFVDDNPVERARIRQSLPMVAVPELPEDAAQYVRCIADAGYFEAVAFTSEDRHRARQYAANAEREALLGSAQSMDEFLRGLKMSVAVRTVHGRRSRPHRPADQQDQSIQYDNSAIHLRRDNIFYQPAQRFDPAIPPLGSNSVTTVSSAR